MTSGDGPAGPPEVSGPPEISGPFAATHTARRGGQRTWPAPDGTGEPGPRLPDGLAVQVIDTIGDWSRVRCENDWTAWVDGRLLVPLATATAPTVTTTATATPVVPPPVVTPVVTPPVVTPVVTPPVVTPVVTPLVTPPAQPTPVWRATHRAGAGGVACFERPDPAATTTYRLDPWLEIQVDEIRGGWAHAVCSNGWATWVDLRLIEALG